MARLAGGLCFCDGGPNLGGAGEAVEALHGVSVAVEHDGDGQLIHRAGAEANRVFDRILLEKRLYHLLAFLVHRDADDLSFWSFRLASGTALKHGSVGNSDPKSP